MTHKGSEYGIDLAHELCVAAAKAGFTTPELYKLSQHEDVMRQMRQVLLGYASVTAVEHIIDCDADPFNPWVNDGWTIAEHRKSGQWKWDSARVSLWTPRTRKDDRHIYSYELCAELSDKPILNANVLDYLLAHPYLIPEEWKKNADGSARYTFFLGTIYRNPSGHMCVRDLFGGDDGWHWGRRWLGDNWNIIHPAAIRAW